MRLLALILAMFSLCLGPIGCSMFDKNKTSSANGTNGGARDTDKAKTDPLFGSGANTARTETPRNTPSEAPAIFAGRVIDDYDKGMDRAHVLLAQVDKDGSEPMDVQVQSGGYFMIENVKPGVQYKLTARAKNGEQMMAGVIYATAPNSRLLIQVDSRFANKDTPPLPGPPTSQGKPAKTTKMANPEGEGIPSVGGITLPGQSPYAGQTYAGQTPPTPFTPRLQADQEDPQDLPVRIGIPVSNAGPANPNPPGWTPGWNPQQPPSTSGSEKGPSVAGLPSPPTPIGPNNLLKELNIKGPTRRPGDERLPVPPPSPPLPGPPPPEGEPPPPNLHPERPQTDAVRLTEPGPAARVPSCVVKNDRLVSFALPELNMNLWEYRNRPGKLVLLDFWATWCPPCRETIPKLRGLQQRYGTKGLEVIGIACEGEGSPQAQAQRVNRMCRDMFVNYRQLLSVGTDCPVFRQFRISSLPTLVLIDDTGKVLWLRKGALEPNSQGELERVIQQHLHLQP